ncbi:MAG TPA: shikimate kinase [Acidimicrobiia bacterium]|nr:shikimate kinase [Acidimicrobiia bacterium]
MGTLWIVGMMGSGKTTVAGLVAAALGRPLVDTDETVVAATGRSIPDWFSADLDGFREAERAAVMAAAGRAVVVACGGGAVLDEGSVAAMRRSGLVVWLDVPVAALTERVGSGSGRPLLGEDPAHDLERIRTARLAAYRAAAHVTVPGTGGPGEMAEAVIAAWKISS